MIKVFENEVEKYKFLVVENEFLLFFGKVVDYGEFKLIVNRKEIDDMDYVKFFIDKIKERDLKVIVLNII